MSLNIGQKNLNVGISTGHRVFTGYYQTGKFCLNGRIVWFDRFDFMTQASTNCFVSFYPFLKRKNVLFTYSISTRGVNFGKFNSFEIPIRAGTLI